jgi:hypothetical protein
VGGLIGLAVPPFQVLERGFYKSSAGVFLASAVLFLGGKIALAARGGSLHGLEAAEIALWTGFVAAMSAYLASLWGDSGARRARSYTLSLGLGLVALSVSAEAYRLGPALSPSALLYPVAVLAGALALGAVATGMLLGHWYLIDLGLSIVPLRRVFRFYVAVLLIQLGTFVLTLGVVALGSSAGGTAVATLWRDHGGLLAARVLLGPVAGLGIGWLIHRTLQIPQTMAATGLFYVAILAVMVGEMLGKLILFRTSLPL